MNNDSFLIIIKIIIEIIIIIIMIVIALFILGQNNARKIYKYKMAKIYKRRLKL